MQLMNETNTTLPPITPYPLPLISFEVLLTFCLIYACLAIMAVFGNTLVVMSYIVNQRLRTPTNFFVVSLASADIMVGAIAIPVWMYVLYAHTQNGPNIIMHSIWRILDMLAGTGSILHLMIISIERACAIAIPIRHRNVNKKVYKITLMLIWLTAVLGSTVTQFASQVWLYTLVFNTVVFFFAPLCVITVAYFVIYTYAKKAAKRRQKRLNKDMRLAGTILMVIGLFLVAWLPFFITGLIALYCNNCEYQIELGLSFKILHYGNSVVNPIIYSIRIPQFRRAFLKLLCRYSHNAGGALDVSSTYARNTLNLPNAKYTMVVSNHGKEKSSSSSKEECCQVETVL